MALMANISREEFNNIVKNTTDRAVALLTKKNAAYSAGVDDPLHNFRKAANLQGVSIREAAAGMMAKHTVSVFDLCMRDDLDDMATWDEKILDHINYLLFLRAMATEEYTAMEIKG